MAQEKTPLDEWLQMVTVSPGIPSRDPAVLAECQTMAMYALNFKALQQIRFLGLNDPTVR